jgi:pimeloyl-ACP methyl ester carboxylesterase/acyl carrier protein
MPCSGIEQRVRALSPAKRALLVKRLRESPGPGVAAGHVNGARLTAFLSAEPSALDRLEVESDELRAYLSRLLPEYMIPASFRVLDSMPLLPNGKVDVAALGELPGEVDSTAESWVEPRNATEQLLADIWCDVLQMDSVSVHDNFFELGGDSILSIHVVSKVNQQGFSLSPNDLFNFPTIAQLEARIRATASKRGQSSPPYDGVEVTSSLRESAHSGNDVGSSAVVAEDSKPSFIMLHVGNQIASLLQSHLDRPVYVLTAHWEDANIEPDTSIEQLAEQNLAELRSLQPVGPYFLGGYSMGAPIALEMAQRLRIAGENVELLFLLDPTGRPAIYDRPRPPVAGPRNKDADRLSSRPIGSSTVANHLARVPGPRMAAKFGYVIVKVKQQISHRFSRLLRAILRLRVLRPAKTGLVIAFHSCGLKMPTRMKKYYVRTVYTDAVSRYEFKPYDGPVVLFLASKSPTDKQLWEGVARGKLTVEWFRGRHIDFSRNPKTMNRWTSRLAQLLMTYQTTGCAGNTDGQRRDD